MNTEINFDELRELLEARNFKALRTRLADMNEVDVAQFLCELAPEDARILFRARGIAIAAYFSKPDWHCPWYWAEGMERPVGSWRNPTYLF